jgi:hypothetical protein
MTTVNLCAAAVLAVLVSSVGASAQEHKQFQKGSMSSGDFSDNKIGPGAAKTVAAAQRVETAEASAALDANNLWANWPYVAVFIACAGLAEKMRQRRGENMWQRVRPAEGCRAPLVQTPIEAMTPAFRPLTPADMMTFGRGNAAARAGAANLNATFAESAPWQTASALPLGDHRAPRA